MIVLLPGGDRPRRPVAPGGRLLLVISRLEIAVLPGRAAGLVHDNSHPVIGVLGRKSQFTSLPANQNSLNSFA